MKVLQLSVHLSPNIGGVETHLDDLFKALVERNWNIFALAYQPLSTKTDWKLIEKSKNLTIFRIPWVRGFFEKLVNYPLLEFIYLIPGLLFLTPFIIIFYKPDVIHAHGLSAAVAGVLWGRFFNIRSVISLHSIYSFPQNGLYNKFVKLLFNNCDFILSLSKKSNQEILDLGIKRGKTSVFTYWIDLQRFKNIPSAKEQLGFKDKFIVLFVGRLIEEKGLNPLVEAASLWDKSIKLLIIGRGSMEDNLLKQSNKYKNISLIGKIDQEKLSLYYSCADCVIVPSTSEEGFGRVIIEALSCETPVLASKRGSISEAMDETVGIFIDVTARNIRNEVMDLYRNPSKLKKLSQNARMFVERRYGELNVKTIINTYTK